MVNYQAKRNVLDQEVEEILILKLLSGVEHNMNVL